MKKFLIFFFNPTYPGHSIIEVLKKNRSQTFLKFDFVKKHAFFAFFSLIATFHNFDYENSNKIFYVRFYDRLLCFLKFLGFSTESFVRTIFLLLMHFQKIFSQTQAKFRTETLPKFCEFLKVFPSIS